MVTADPKFASAMRVTFVYVALSVPLKLAFALVVAMALNRGLRGLTVYRAIFYLPSLLGASVAIAVLWRQLSAADGMINSILALFGIDGPSWISNPRYSLYTLVVLSVWQFGSPMIIFLAGLRQIPTDMYEAASIDGASPLRQFFKITLPLLSPVVFFNLVIQTIEAFKAFTRPSSSRRHRWSDQLDAVLHALSLPGGLQLLPHGLRLGARLGAGDHRRLLHRLLLPFRQILGALR
jgi:carbohydrate ABC transporter membrane protein 1, CUT1 family (TC 3.A.1.1.-)